MWNPFLRCTLLAATASTCVALEPQQVIDWPRSQVEQALPAAHPMAYYLYAARLFRNGDKEDVLFWYDIGEIRFRFYLAVNPNLPEDAAPALFASLHESVGSVVAQWGRTVPEVSARELQRAMDWDASNDNAVTSKSAHAKTWRDVREEVREAATLRQD